MVNHVGKPAMFEGNRFFPLTGMPIWKMERIKTVIAITADSVFLDIGYKSEGILPLADFQSKGQEVKLGDKLLVSVKGRDADGYYELSRTKISRPKDWSALEQAFTEKATIVGTVTGVVKGGL